LYQEDAEVTPEAMLHLIEPKITTEMNDMLCKPFTEKEISDSLFHMGPLKAPGSDGFPARFFQKHWDFMKDDVVAAVQSFFPDGTMPDGINETTIVLIPKGLNPEELKDFRPISLCNVIYKIISRCMVNKLKPILDEIISPEQSAFVPTRRIIDNALIAFECVHSIKHKAGNRGEFCAHKLDLSKAFDRCLLGFLKECNGEAGLS
jgi:hypothetical protein